MNTVHTPENKFSNICHEIYLRGRDVMAQRSYHETAASDQEQSGLLAMFSKLRNKIEKSDFEREGEIGAEILKDTAPNTSGFYCLNDYTWLWVIDAGSRHTAVRYEVGQENVRKIVDDSEAKLVSLEELEHLDFYTREYTRKVKEYYAAK